MTQVWKVLVVLAFVLPVGGFVVGSLVATSAGDPAPRAPMRIAPAGQLTPAPTTPADPQPSGSTGARTPEARTDDGGQRPDDDRGPSGVPIPVTPEPEGRDDDDRDDREDRDDDGDVDDDAGDDDD